jgi:hypothetical protein
MRGAIDHGNLTEALASASEMEHISLVEALELCLPIGEKQPAKNERAALRWHARHCAESGHVRGNRVQVVLGLLLMIPGERGRESATALAHLMGEGQVQDRAAGVLLS